VVLITLCSVFFLCHGAAVEPHRDAVHQHTLNGAAVEDGQQLPLQVDPPENPQKVELGSLHDCRDVGAPLEVCVHLHAQELQAEHPLHTLTLYVDGLQISLPPPEVHNHFLCLGGVVDQVVVCTLPYQPLEPLPVGYLIASVEESH